MKTLAILLASVLAAGSLVGCAVEPETVDSGGLRPARKPLLDSPSAQAGANDGIDDGRVMWVEVFATDDATFSKVHHFDSETGIDTIELLDQNDVVQRIETRYQATEIPVGTRR